MIQYLLSLTATVAGLVRSGQMAGIWLFFTGAAGMLVSLNFE